MPVRAVLFDLGGTLLDTHDPLGWSRVAESLGVAVEPDHLAHAAREVEAEFDAKGLPEDREFWSAVLTRAAGRPVAPDVGEEFLARWRAGPFRPPLFSDARYCLEQLFAEGFPMAVVSNSESEARIRGLIAEAGIARFFAAYVSSGTEGVWKPDARIFRVAVDRLHVTPEEAIYVGDLARTDALGARAAGLYGLWLNRYGWGFGDDPPEITSLAELPGLVRELARAPPR